MQISNAPRIYSPVPCRPQEVGMYCEALLSVVNEYTRGLTAAMLRKNACSVGYYLLKTHKLDHARELINMFEGIH